MGGEVGDRVRRLPAVNESAFPVKLTFSAFRDGEPFAGAWFELEIEMRRKNNYRALVGPADGAGVLVAQWAAIEDQCRHTLSFFLMDYVDLRWWTGKIAASVVDRAACARILAAADFWGAFSGGDERRSGFCEYSVLQDSLPPAELTVRTEAA